MERYTLEDLEKAKEEQERLENLVEEEDAKNVPIQDNIHGPAFKAINLHVKEIEAYLKASGVIPYTFNELAQDALNEKYPNAQSRDIEMHEGYRFQKRFFPVKRSKTGKTVKEWRSDWINMDVREE